MTFALPLFLLGLILVAALMLLEVWRPKRPGLLFSSLRGFMESRAMLWCSRVPNMLRWVCLALLVIAMARPQLVSEQSKRMSEGLDIMMAIDTSGSMRALDFEVGGERQDRLTAVVDVIGRFVRERANDRIGFVVFGQEAFTQAPLTLDHRILEQFLREIKIGMAGDATAIGEAIAVSAARLEKVKSPSRVVILLTDGRNTAGTVDPETAARAAAALGIRVYTIGAGAEGRIPYPVETPFGTRIQYIESDLDEALLQRIATMTGGQYFRAYDTTSLQSVYETIDKLEKARLERPEQNPRQDMFAWFIAIALMALVLEALVGLTRLRKVPV